MKGFFYFILLLKISFLYFFCILKIYFAIIFVKMQSIFKIFYTIKQKVSFFSVSQKNNTSIDFFLNCSIQELNSYYPEIHHTKWASNFKQALADQIKMTSNWHHKYEKSLLFWSWFKEDPCFQRYLNKAYQNRPQTLNRYCSIDDLRSHCSSALSVYLKNNYATLTLRCRRGANKKVRPLFDLATGQFVAGSIYNISQPIQNICQFINQIPPHLTTNSFEAKLNNCSFSSREKSLLRWLYWCPHLPLAPLFTIDNYSKRPLLIQSLADCTLSDWIKKKGLSKKEKLHFCINCLKITAKLHQQGYAHRDIKPNNILVYNHQLKWGDLDNMTPAKNNHPDSNTYATAFKAPEIWKNKPWNSFKADAYALGLTLTCILSDVSLPPIAILNWAQYPTTETPALASYFKSDIWTAIIQGLLHQNPNKRLSVVDALNRIHYTLD